MMHLPHAHADQDDGLCQRPPQDTLAGALAGLAEALLAVLLGKPKKKPKYIVFTYSHRAVCHAYPLIVLLLGDLLHLVEQLPNAQL